MKNDLEQLSSWYGNTELDFDRELIAYRYQSIKQWFKPGIALEIAPAQGVMTQWLVNDFYQLHLVEGSKNLLDQIPDYPNVTKFHSMVEDFQAPTQYNTIIMDHVLEHIEHPVQALSAIRNWLVPGGVFMVGVPNALSFHRQLGVKMGRLNSVYELNERDHQLGHYRVYDTDSLNMHMKEAGFEVIANDGVFFKLLSNGQIQETFSQEMKDACYELGKDFKPYCAEIYAIATVNE